MPVDTPSQLTTDSLTWEVVPIWGVIDNISKKKVGLGFIRLDACRDNAANVQTPDGISKSVEKGLGKAVMLQSEMLIAYAANYGQISLGSMNPNENSLYTGHLVRNIDSEGRNIIEILQDVHAAVQVDCRQRNCNQYPIFEAAGGTFYPRSSDYTKKVARELA